MIFPFNLSIFYYEISVSILFTRKIIFFLYYNYELKILVNINLKIVIFKCFSFKKYF